MSTNLLMDVSPLEVLPTQIFHCVNILQHVFFLSGILLSEMSNISLINTFAFS